MWRFAPSMQDVYSGFRVPGSDAPWRTSPLTDLHGVSHLCTVPASTTPTDMHIPSRCLSATPERVWSRDRNVVEASGLNVLETVAYPALPDVQCNLFQSNNRFLMSLPSLPGLFPHPNKRTRDASSTGTRGSVSLLGCSPSVLWTLPCFARVQLFSATFRADFFTTVHWIAIFLTRNKLQIRACSSDTQLYCFRYPPCSLATACPFFQAGVDQGSGVEVGKLSRCPDAFLVFLKGSIFLYSLLFHSLFLISRGCCRSGVNQIKIPALCSHESRPYWTM